MTKDIFISYSRWNLDKVKAIKKEIEQATDAECWMDLNAIESGATQFTQDIVDGIKSCRVFLFMLSEESQNSKFALRELNFAMKKNEKEKQKHVVIVNIDDCHLTDEFEFMYGLTDTINWNIMAQREKMMRDLKKWLGINEIAIHEIIQTESKLPNIASQSVPSDKGRTTFRKKRIWGWIAFIATVLIMSVIVGFCYEPYDAEQLESMAIDYYNSENTNDHVEAFKLYKRAAKLGSVKSMCDLAYCYKQGKGTPKDYKEAIRWYRMAAENGDELAYQYMGEVYTNMGQYDDAMKCFQKAVDIGCERTNYYIGKLYEEGLGVTKDLSKAIYYYQKAAEAGYPFAERRLEQFAPPSAE